MAKKDKTLVVPTLKPRNPLYNHPLMTRGGAQKDSFKAARRQQNMALHEVVNEDRIIDNPDDFDEDSYGFGP